MINFEVRVIEMISNFTFFIFFQKLNFDLSVWPIPPLVEELFEWVNILKFKTVVLNTYFELIFRLTGLALVIIFWLCDGLALFVRMAF